MSNVAKETYTSTRNQSGKGMQVVSLVNTKNTSPDMTQYSYIPADSLMAVTSDVEACFT